MLVNDADSSLLYQYVGGSMVDPNGRDSPTIFAYEVVGKSYKWKYRLDYLSTAQNDASIDLSEYYTVDSFTVMYSVSHLLGFSACYDVNGYPKQNCGSFLIYHIFD